MALTAFAEQKADDMMMTNDTVCAPATASGGALCVVRVAGPEAIAVTDKVFTPRHGAPLGGRAGYTLVFGDVHRADGSLIDEVLVSVFRAPHSYTGEDSVEISCHGSAYIVSELMARLVEAGCRMARPGEFTERAFLNGKMDLSQAEAVADVIASTSRAAHQVAMSQMRGGFSRELAALRDRLLHFASLMELELDFSDHEDLEFADRSELLALAEEIEGVIGRLASSFRAGNVIKNGVPVAIVGETNAGKSTLLNTLLGEERAIVSEVHGTTRDVIEDTVTLDGVMFRFIDTAGLRQTTDVVENMGIGRTYEKMEQAAVVLWVVDATDVTAATRLQPEILARVGDTPLLVLFNKCDKLSAQACQDTAARFEGVGTARLFISAREGTHVDELRRMLVEAAALPDLSQDAVVVTNARHHEALLCARDAIHRAHEGLMQGLSGDFVSQDIRECIHHLSDIAGYVTSESILQTIFSRFCIGK